MDARPTSRVLLGPATPYAVFTVRGVTYSYSAPTVTLTPFTADELETLEIAARYLGGDDAVVPPAAGETNNTVVRPAAEPRFVPDRGWVDARPEPEPARDRPSKRAFLTRCFPFGTFATAVPACVWSRYHARSRALDDVAGFLGRAGGRFSGLRKAARAINLNDVADLYDAGKWGRLRYEWDNSVVRSGRRPLAAAGGPL